MTLFGSRVFDGGGPHSGILALPQTDFNAMIGRLRKRWTDLILRYTKGKKDTANRTIYPFSDRYDLSKYSNDVAFNRSMQEIARMGYDLYQALFLAADRQLKQGLEQVSALLKDSEQTVSFVSDNLLIPWSMLYLPGPNEDIDDANWRWSFEGFLGYKHRVEQTLHERPRGWSHRVAFADRVCVGVYADTRLNKMRVPVLAPVLDVLEGMKMSELMHLDLCTDRPTLKKALESDRHGDHLMYFICHGYSATATEQAHVKLSDGVPIYASDFAIWLGQKELEQNPVIFVMACQGGQLASMLHTSFGLWFLKMGGNCLVGPQIDIPPDFAQEYSKRFLEEAVAGRRIGDVVVDLCRSFADKYNNPLGLVISLYRGMDTYFAHEAALESVGEN